MSASSHPESTTREESIEVAAASSSAAGMKAAARRAATGAGRGRPARVEARKGSARQSRPVKLDPTVNMEPRGGRYFVYRPPLMSREPSDRDRAAGSEPAEARGRVAWADRNQLGPV